MSHEEALNKILDLQNYLIDQLNENLKLQSEVLYLENALKNATKPIK